MRPLAITLALLFACIVPLSARADDERAPFFVNYAARVDGRELALYRTAILSPDATITNPEAAGDIRILGYVSLGELSAEDAARPEAKGIPTLGANRAWKSVLPDVTSREWSDWILKRCAPKVAARGWRGLFLDTLDSARLPAGLTEAAYAERERALATLLRQLRAQHPGMLIVANRGFRTLDLAPEAFDGVLAEGVLSTHAGPGRYVRVTEAETAALRAELDRWKRAGKRTLALDYCSPDDRPGARELYARLTGFGYEAAVATPDLLEGSALAPLRRESDRALVVFGKNPGQGLIDHPSSCETQDTLKHPIEWHGYTVDYVNVRQSGFPDMSPYDLVVLEHFEPESPSEFEEFSLRVAERLRSPRKKTVFLTDFTPWIANPACWRNISEAAGWSGSGDYRQPASPPAPVAMDPAVARGEGGAKPRVDDPLPDLVAPPDARPLIRQSASDPEGEFTSDSVFAAPFGGVLLGPWLKEIDPIGREKTRTDLFAFADRVLGEPVPAFDTTTRDGCRLFFAHVDGDGLQARSLVDLDLTSGEVMRDEIFKAYPLPFTVSVITGEIRGMTEPRASAAEVALRRDIARSIFALPNVEIACHTFSHPFAWTNYSVTSKTYAAPRLQLLPEFDHPLDMREETLGAIEYIDKNLAPPGKRCRILLWSGNCLPPPEAIAELDSAGLPNLNGLTGAPTFDNPFLSNIRGGAMRYLGRTQVGAPFENDNVYYDMEKDGLENGFERVIEAFEITAAPRRLLPVNAYWHFFSAERTDRLRALRRVLDWAMARPLHPVTAADYALMMRDLDKGVRFDDARGGRLFLMPPGCLTLRYQGAVHVDMEKSTGVLGYRQELGVTYVHTDGSPRVRIHTRPDDDRRARLVFSTRPVRVTRAPQSWSATFGGFAPGKARFAGIAPGAVVKTRSGAAKADADGEIEITATPGETVRLPLR